ncbi:hypothetical protein [Methylobacterium sp. 1030]|uniref:hypothetical protein n=1 Tax=Methylobacterium sp. 1030 TaxID=3156404 RepID=UPI0033926DA7
MTASVMPTPAATEAIRWDAEAEAFLRLTLAPCGRILARRDLEPVEKRAALRHLFLTRTTTMQRRAVGRLLDRAGLLLRPEPSACRGDAAALSRRFLAGAAHSDLIAFVERLGIETRPVLVLAWALGLARAAPGQALPCLEDLDPDLPFVTPIGPSPMEAVIDLDAILEEADAASLGASVEFS